MRPQASVDRLKPVPPMQANDLPVVGQALSPAPPILSHLLMLAPLIAAIQLLVAAAASQAHGNETGGHEHEGGRFGGLTVALIGAKGL